MYLNVFFYLLRLRRNKSKCVKTRCYQEGVGQFERRFHCEVVVPGEYFLVFDKTRHILLSDSANCTVLSAVVLTQYRPVSDGQTDRQTELPYSACNASIAARCKNEKPRKYSVHEVAHRKPAIAAGKIYNVQIMLKTR